MAGISCTVDVLNLDIFSDTIAILQRIINDEDTPEIVKLRYREEVVELLLIYEGGR